jgi:hypothetical protein
MAKLKDATTLYVGNLFVIAWIYSIWPRTTTNPTFSRSFYTTEEQIHELFSK